jgi:hypothetical protein
MNGCKPLVQVRATLPAAAYIGVKNPNNAMAKELLYPDQTMIDCLSELDAVVVLALPGGVRLVTSTHGLYRLSSLAVSSTGVLTAK